LQTHANENVPVVKFLQKLYSHFPAVAKLNVQWVVLKSVFTFLQN